MNTNRSTYILIGFFFASLLVYWGLDRAGVLTEKERRRREVWVLPELIDMADADLSKVEIDRGKERLVFERRGPGTRRWQMVEPLGIAAEPGRLETLIRNLKELRKSIDSGSVTGPADAFGLAPPEATIKVWAAPKKPGNDASGPVATLEVGKSVRGVRYVRPSGAEQIEVADAKLLSAVDSPILDWREQVVMAVPTFQVAAVTIKRDNKVIRAKRGDRGRWRLTEPIAAPANPAKIESLIAALASLRVVGGEKGFVADNVKDFGPFGLASPRVTVELTTTRPSDEPMVLCIGKPVADDPERVFVRQGDQDDVVIVSAKALREIPTDAVSLRSQQVADVDTEAVTRIEIQSNVEKFVLEKGPNAWELSAPRSEKADIGSVRAFLGAVAMLHTSEFLDPKKVGKPELDPPFMTIKVWQGEPLTSASAASPGPPELALRIGKRDSLKKIVYARLEDDQVILALPDKFLEVLPRNTLAFRDLTILSLNPADVRMLTITRAGRTDELEPSKGGEPNRWQLRRPIEAPADTASVTQALAILSHLRAEQLITDSHKEDQRFGLEHPLLEIGWETDRAHRLKIGGPVPQAAAHYATDDAGPYVFTLKTDLLRPFTAEFHDHAVLSFPAAKAKRMVLRWGWPKRTVGFRHRSPSAKGELEWVNEPGSDARGLDQSRAGPVIKAMTQLQTERFVQYDGALPAFTGLHRPRLTVEVFLDSTEPDRLLKIGYPASEGHVFATVGNSGSGPVFLLPAIAWNALIASGERFDPLPQNVFAPPR
jgi:hypothetical protein